MSETRTPKRECYNCVITESRYLCERCRQLYEFTPEGRMVVRRERSEPAAASVPQGGEFTAADVKEAIEKMEQDALGVADELSILAMLRAYARALSSAPGERT
jgi:hypothetical protein